MKVKIVILNWNGRAHLERFLPSVVAHSGEASVVVADNGSNDDSVPFLREHYPQVELLQLDQNYGFAEGYNRALSRIEADCYVLLNSDVEVEEGWLNPLVARLAADEKVAALAPKIISYERKSDFEYAGAAGGFIDCFGYPFCRGRILDTIEKDQGQYDTAREVFWASGACMVVRADLFHKLGGFDGDFFAHMEEIDLCWRMQLAGYRVMVVPRSRVFHLGGGTLPNNSARKLYLNYRNNLSMLFKNLSRRSLLPVLFARMVLDGMSAMVFLLQRRPDFFKVVFRAHMDFYHALGTLRIKRRVIQQSRIASASSNIYKGSIILRHALGKRTFDHLM